jgi:hypothetical protein
MVCVCKRILVACAATLVKRNFRMGVLELAKRVCRCRSVSTATRFLLDTIPRTLAFSAVVVGILGGCRPATTSDRPSIEFNGIPPAAEGGSERVDRIAGHVIGARPGQRVVVYAKSGTWWVQPSTDQPLIPIQPDSKWSTVTHLGYEYAALLVEPAYRPPTTMDVLPDPGGAVVAVSIVKGVGSLPPNPTKPLRFSGYDWKVRTVAAVRGGLNNSFDADNAWTDDRGALHLRIAEKSGKWFCAEVDLARSLGYGMYTVVVRDTSHLESAAILSMNTFDVWGGEEQHYRELDIEIGRWGKPGNKNNAQYGVQPFYVPGNVAPFKEPPGTLTHVLRWEPGRASFETVRGSSLRAEGPLVSRHIFTSGVPSAGSEVFQIVLYGVASDTNPLQGETEVVVEKFQYLP